MTNAGGFQAIVFAADRGPGDPVSVATGSACKAFAPVHGEPMILRVLNALEASPLVGDIFIVGPAQATLGQCPGLLQRLETGRVTWLAPRDSLAASVEYSLGQVRGDRPLFLTTADHALLSASILDSFLSAARDLDGDAAIGLVPYARISEAYPGTRKTVTRFRDGGYCGCNLYVLSPVHARRLVAWWQQAAEKRKRPAAVMLKLLGPRLLGSYLLGRLSLERAMSGISGRLGITVNPVVLSDPHAGIDVDDASDLKLVESIIAMQAGGKCETS